jgi:hypothetical protein
VIDDDKGQEEKLRSSIDHNFALVCFVRAIETSIKNQTPTRASHWRNSNRDWQRWHQGRSHSENTATGFDRLCGSYGSPRSLRSCSKHDRPVITGRPRVCLRRKQCRPAHKLRHQPDLNICLSYPVNNAPFAEIIGRHHKLYAIAQVKADEAFPHLT